MATQTQPLTRDQLAALPDSYFKAVDAKDVDAILSHFADDAVMTVQTANASWNGADEIRRMFTDFCDGSVSIFHEIKNIVVEPEAGKVATEQSYIGELVARQRLGLRGHECLLARMSDTRRVYAGCRVHASRRASVRARAGGA